VPLPAVLCKDLNGLRLFESHFVPSLCCEDDSSCFLTTSITYMPFHKRSPGVPRRRIYTRIPLVGDFQLYQADALVTTLQNLREQSLLAFLLLYRGFSQSRQHLAFAFWPDSTEA
jgi:hypothetical protein